MISMFRSARLKLTLFYLATLLLFSLSVTTTIRLLAEQEYNRSNDVQRNEVRDILLDGVWGVRTPTRDFYALQDAQQAIVRQHLNQQLVFINLVALVLGGWLSYWFAGRTLRPIEEAHETQARFAADASHELRTPLTNMRLENEVFLRQKQFTDDEARDLIKSNLEEVQRLEQLSASLLELTKYGQGALQLTPQRIETIVAEAVGRMKKPARDKKAKIVQEIVATEVLGDRDSLLQMISIVLDNAIKYGPREGEVKVTGELAADAYILRVHDQGPGIDEADLPQIFDRLYRGDKARTSKAGGYGLGLALAREIAEANNATIEARNDPQGGAIFELCFTRSA